MNCVQCEKPIRKKGNYHWKKQKLCSIGCRTLYLRGKKMSLEARKKISIAHKGMKYPKEFGENLSRILKGRRLNPKGEFKKGHSSPRKGLKYPQYSGKNHPNWKGGQKIKECEICGGVFKVYPFEKEKHRFCSSKCMLKWRSKIFKGETHPMWQGGKSFEPYPLGWNKTHKEQIRYRDGYKCQLCGVPEIENGRRLAVHHIDYDKNNLKEENLISLCINCHAKTNVNRKYWTIFLSQSLLRIMNEVEG